MKEIDARGLACPAPVLEAKNAIEDKNLNSIEVLVDNEASRQNVSRFLKSQGFEVSVQEREGDFHVTGRREGGVEPEDLVDEKQDAEKKKIMSMPESRTCIFFIVFPLFIGYSIVKHDLFDIDTIIKLLLLVVPLGKTLIVCMEVA